MRIIAATLTAATLVFGAPAKVEPNESEVQDIINKFAAKETQFLKARETYTYRQTARIQEVEETGRVIGRHEVVSDIIFSSEGKRTERVVRAPSPTLRNISLSPEDEQDLRSVQPFVLNSQDINLYHVRYLGRETLDEISCYAFAVKPKKMEPGKRYFSGIVWVDDRDLQIVKTFGRGEGLRKKNYDQAFPKFETFREQIDGKFWFPTYTVSNDTLIFDSGLTQKIKMTVKYENYKQFKSDVNITFGDVADTTQTGQKPAEPPKKQ
ncbi:MAG: outer membrane lipoprotein-sorting protein [Acidobacteria bacterium]|nr:outer membrane lipoprotein-sorting protein [Acidobacteriota bacterium]